MILSSDGTTLDIQRRQVIPVGQVGAGDIRLSVQVSVPGFSGSNDEVWASRESCAGFLTELRALEARRSGEARLGSASPGDLELRVQVYDHAGHVRIVGHIGDDIVRPGGVQSARVPFRLEIDPAALPQLLASLAAILGWQTCESGDHP